MSEQEKEKIQLSPEEATFIQTLLTKNKKNIKNVVRVVLGRFSDELAEDCISEISILAIKKTKMLMMHENPDGWLLVASKKVAANFIRKEYTRLKNTSNEILIDIPTDKNAVYEEALYNIWMENNSIQSLLDSLTAREKEVYELLYKKRMTSKQAGEILGISDSTVRSIDGTLKNKIKDGIKKLT